MPITVEGADGQTFEFPDGTSQEVMKAALRKHYVDKTPGFLKPYAERLPGQVEQQKNEAIDYYSRTPEVANAYEGDRSDMAAYEAFRRQEGERRAKREDYLLPEQPKQSRAQAVSTGIADTALKTPVLGDLAYAGIDSVAGDYMDQPARQAMRSASANALADHPFSKRVGDAAGFMAGLGRVGWQAGERFIQRPLTNALQGQVAKTGMQGASRKALDYGARAASTIPVVMADAAVFGGLVEAENQTAAEGRAPTAGERASMGARIATDPITIAAGPATSAVARAGKFAKSGGQTFTPDSITAERIVSDLGVDLGAETLRPQSIEAFNRLLRASGLDDDTISAVSQEVGNRARAAESGTATGRKRVFQHYMEVLAEDPASPFYNPQAAMNIQMTVQERANSAIRGDRSGGIVGEAVSADRASQVPFLESSARQNLGDGTRLGAQAQVKDAKAALSSEYERILSSAPTTGEGADALRALIKADPQKNAVLRRRAKNAGLSVDEYIEQNPYAAGHWMRSKLSSTAQSATGREKADLLDTVNQIDDVLDGFDSYAATKRAWGTEESLLKAQGFGDKLFGGAQSNLMNNPGLKSEMVQEFNNLPDAQKVIALVSIRDQALGKLAGGQASEGAQARVTALNTHAALDFLDQVGATGFADDIRAIARENQLLSVADAGNPLRQSATFSNQQARLDAPALYNSTIANAVSNSTPGTVLGEGALMAFAPHYQGAYAAYRGTRLGAERLFGTRTRTLEDMTKFLMGRADNQPRANALAEPASTSTRTPGVNALAGQGEPVKQGIPTTVGSTVAGGAVGGLGGSVTDLNQDGVIDQQDAFIGAAGGMAAVNAPRAVNALRGRGQGTQSNFFVRRDGGELRSEVKGDAVINRSIFVDPEKRGQGVAVSMYQEVANNAHKQGKVVLSDRYVEPEAAEAIRALERRGYQIIDRYDPATKTGPGGDHPFVILPKDSKLTYDEAIAQQFDPSQRANYLQSRGGGLGVIDGGNDGTPPAQGGLGAGQSAPAGETARLQRAREMGFNTDQTLYHGTRDNFDAFEPSRAGVLGKGVYLSPDKEAARMYSSIQGGQRFGGKSTYDKHSRLLELHVRGEILDITEPLSADHAKRLNARAKELGWESAFKEGQSVSAQARNITGLNTDTLPDLARGAGFKGARQENSGGPVTVVFDPKDLRRTDAQFDPAKSDSPILTAGMGAINDRIRSNVNDMPMSPTPQGQERAVDTVMDQLGDVSQLTPKSQQHLQGMQEMGEAEYIRRFRPRVDEMPPGWKPSEPGIRQTQGDGVNAVWDYDDLLAYWARQTPPQRGRWPFNGVETGLIAAGGVGVPLGIYNALTSREDAPPPPNQKPQRVNALAGQ